MLPQNKISFTACMEFMKAWSKQNKKYIQSWSTGNGRLAFLVYEQGEVTFPMSTVNEFYELSKANGNLK